MAISQREAQRLRKRVELLEGILSKQRRIYSQEYFHGTEIRRLDCRETAEVLRVARRLKHGVVAVPDDSGNTIRFVALPHPSEDI